MKITPIINNKLIFFTSQRKAGQTYDDFIEYNREFEVTTRISEFIFDENCVGEGRSNKVYKLPHTDKFMLKTYKKLTSQNVFQFQKELTPVPDVFTNINVGQSIARMGQYILILIKQAGEQHSIPFMKRGNIEEADVRKYLSDIRKLAAISDVGYINFTDEVKCLTENNCYIDYFNSNNLMLTPEEINLVDIVRVRRFKQRVFMFPSQESLLKILLDENVLPLVLNRIPEKEKIQLGQNIRIIMNKITEAMKVSNLPQNKVLTSIIDFLSDNFHNGENYKFKASLKTCLKL